MNEMGVKLIAWMIVMIVLLVAALIWNEVRR